MVKNSSDPVLVEGHTDNWPIGSKRFPSNWELSSQRAINVCNFFIDHPKVKLSQKLFSATGYSYYKPIAPNDTEKNMAKNRRIEVRLVYFSELSESILK